MPLMQLELPPEPLKPIGQLEQLSIPPEVHSPEPLNINDHLDRLVLSPEPLMPINQLEQLSIPPEVQSLEPLNTSDHLDRLVLSQEPLNTLIYTESQSETDSETETSALTPIVEYDEYGYLKPYLNSYQGEKIGVGDILVPILAALLYIYCASLMQ